MRVLSQDMALAYDLPFISGKFVRLVAQKKFAFLPHSSIRAKNQEDKRSHFHINNSCPNNSGTSFSFHSHAPRRSILWICSGYTLNSHT